MLDDIFQQNQEMTGHALDAGPIEQINVVAKRAAEPVGPAANGQSQIEFDSASGHIHRFEGEIGGLHLAGGGILEGK